jgi:hypothetical protein
VRKERKKKLTPGPAAITVNENEHEKVFEEIDTRAIDHITVNENELRMTQINTRACRRHGERS